MFTFENVQAGYSSKTVLQGLSFEMDKSAFIGIIGPNGSGKTTLLRVMTKVIQPQSGIVRLNGQNISQMSFSVLAKQVAMVTQASSLAFNIPVQDYILLGRTPHKGSWQFFSSEKDEEIVSSVMEKTDTTRLATKYVHNLSSGERQRTMVARALAQAPEILLLDEPTSHLDITHQVKILNLLKSLNQEQGIGIVVVFHDLNLASTYCEEIFLMLDGRIVQKGKPSEIITPEVIEEVYQTKVLVQPHPDSRKPQIFLA